MRLGTLVCRSGFFQYAVRLIDEVMSLRLAGNTIALMETRIEPLRRIRNTSLIQDTIDQLFIEYLRIFLRGEIPIPLSPYLPAVGHAVRNLFHRTFPPEGPIRLRYPRLAKIFLRKDIGSDLAPLRRHFHIIHFEHHFPAGIPDDR